MGGGVRWWDGVPGTRQTRRELLKPSRFETPLQTRATIRPHGLGPRGTEFVLVSGPTGSDAISHARDLTIRAFFPTPKEA